ncbi:MAG TPA: cyclopropane-fatty-acyl-phospholipid synthase family protein [Rhizomicrobium sp.]|nr:cyclopropane-fatty-acyl-phospholipid synthase family protein [Rhizomicrobium sp.]
MMELVTYLAERMPLPDPALRAGMRRYIAQVEQGPAVPDEAFARAMAGRPIALHTKDANAQHYELPADFFRHFLGPRRKYSCAFYPQSGESLAEAEECALEETALHAALADGQTILELGCGWGSLSLWMAERFPDARITAVSNSRLQRLHIEAEAGKKGLINLKVLTADMNGFEAAGPFDRIVSVEMFEHMANWRPLLTRLRSWLAPDGRLFLHIFTHRSRPSYYEPSSGEWMARHFFAGGIMPSPGLIRQFSDLFTVEEEWRWSGAHYRQTAEQWLGNFDANRAAILPILKDVYGTDASLWRRRWRMFLLATAESFGHAQGDVWGINHYRLAAVR